MIDLKESFKLSIKSLPKSFRIQDDDYYQQIFVVVKGFTIMALLVLGFIIFYLFLRFFCKKCVGPVKISHITKTYRNSTWFFLSNTALTRYIIPCQEYNIHFHNFLLY